MGKLKLDPEALRIESFAPEGEGHGRGTVHGHYSYPMGCWPPSDSDPALESCGYNTCAGVTCEQSCNGYTCACDGGGGGNTLQCDSAGYTYCIRDASCVNACHPPMG